MAEDDERDFNITVTENDGNLSPWILSLIILCGIGEKAPSGWNEASTYVLVCEKIGVHRGSFRF